MNSKTLTILILVVVLVGAGIFATQYMKKGQPQETPEDQSQITPEEKEFNESGRAKAIEDETDLWKFYEDEDAKFSIKHPHDVNFGEEQGYGLYNLTVASDYVGTLEGTMGYDKETALKNMDSLKNGQYGQEVDFPLALSKKVRSLNGVNAQEFMVLARFEVCDVVFERKLYFFNNNYQVVITLSGPVDSFVQNAPEYFETNQENCGDAKAWDFEKQNQFYETLSNGNGSQIIQDWFDLFDRIVNTIEIYEVGVSEKLQGTWVSVDDSNSTIEFAGNKKIDYYQGSKMSEGTFEVNDDEPEIHLLVDVDGEEFKYGIVTLTATELTLLYLPRGNLLEYKRTW